MARGRRRDREREEELAEDGSGTATPIEAAPEPEQAQQRGRRGRRGGGVTGPTSALTSFLREQGITARGSRFDRARPAEEETSSELQEINEELAELTAEATSGPSTSAASPIASGSGTRTPASSAKKSKKPRIIDSDDSDEPEKTPAKKGRYDDRKTGSFAHCSDCHKRFTITDRTFIKTNNEMLCPPCQSEWMDLERETSVAPAPKPKRRATKQKQLNSEIEDGRAKITIKSLQISCIELIGTHIQNVEALGDIGTANLDKIAKIVCKNRALSPDTLKLFLDIQTTDLRLYDCTRLDQDGLQSIPVFSPRIQRMTLVMCGLVDDDVLEQWLSRFEHLTYLELYGPYLVTDAKWQSFFRSRGQDKAAKLSGFLIKQSARIDRGAVEALVDQNAAITHLQLAEIGRLRSDWLDLLTPLTSLVHLDLSHGGVDGDTITDEAVVKLLASVGANLETLILDANSALTEETLTKGIKPHCKKLTHLSLEQLAVSSEGLQDLFTDWQSQSLRRVNLHRCTDMEDEALDALVAHSGSTIEYLDLNSVDNLRELALMRLAKSCPKMIELDLSFVRDVDDFIVKAVLDNMPALTTFFVWGNNRVSDLCPTRSGVKVVGQESQHDCREGQTRSSANAGRLDWASRSACMTVTGSPAGVGQPHDPEFVRSRSTTARAEYSTSPPARRAGGGAESPSASSERPAEDDEAAAQAERDSHFFTGPSSPPLVAHSPLDRTHLRHGSLHNQVTPDRLVDRLPGTAQSHSATAAATAGGTTRFYRHHHRTLSDASLDSQPAYIDHRAQPYSLSSSGGRRAASGLRDEVRRRSNVRRSPMSAGELEDGDESLDDLELPTSSVPFETDETMHGQPRASTLSASRPSVARHRSSGRVRTMRAADLDEQVIDDQADPHAYIRRQQSHRSDRSSRSRRRDNEFDDGSRRPSDAEKVQEDVCFPLLGPDQDTHIPLDPRHEHRLRYDHHYSGVPGVLAHFPFAFDFSALEEFAGKEREFEGLPMGISPARANGGAQAVSFSDSGMPKRERLDSNGNPMPDAAITGSPRLHRNPRNRRLSESQPVRNRYQRKLAQFEGDAEDDAREGKATIFSSTKTPLLTDDKRSNSGFGATGISQRTRSGTTNSDEKARPYRFSFYSNALPSTIHARSLAEIPAEGQTFAELFTGRVYDDEQEGSNRTGAPGEATPSAHPSMPGTGTHSPNEAASQRTSVNMGHQSNQGGPASSRNHLQGSKPKSNVMRTDDDAEANTWWLDVLCPTDQEMRVLSKVFGIHPLTTEDIQMEEAREKIELFRNYYLVCFRSFDQDPYSPTYLEPLNMYIIVFREGTLSFHFRGAPHPQNVRRRIKQLKDYINVTSDWISYALIDDITDAFAPLIQNIEYEVDSIDELVLILKDAGQGDMLRRIGTCRKKVMGLLRLLGSKADVVKGLAKRCNENWSVAPKSDIGLYLSDIQDHILTMNSNLAHYEKILSRAHANHLAQMSIEMTIVNNDTNNLLGKLSALGAVLLPMSLVTGIWGMNVHVPGQDVENLNWFAGIISCLVFFGLIGGYFTNKAFNQ
ncbi:uncharacterized protein L969DRAFT_46361 [Mixia osmundae IAM 14324]|uniref:DNA repair protein rhp7 treble clef domain-containing protein n=1 Tax=Mixia osmundae (strain CBS 9802 / IAM 14324 / JCM 22182 / KY 12970) TaxID=764103 RepID=G7E5A7_MIXOS|nr:uncharacterized protein L969DRAFT_46361 [Mixia osmundae IAM 14324]KEI40833.1 hypothetical protein L969DRAFT_46361 [Mixia osmundae IAM 14324]GAA98017.1 hypothetical protein E5Q_04697 [Mixia osmundae IAM 14324]